MKKLLTITAVSFFIGISVNNADAQTFSSEIRQSATAAKTTKVNGLVRASFSILFPYVTDAAWVKNGNGYMSRFAQNDIEYFVYFSKKGDCENVIRYYTEKDLPAEIGKQVKQAYGCATITSVKEITHRGSKAYLITVDYGETWKVIRFVDGEMDIWEQYVKG